MRKRIGKGDVALHRSRRQARGRPRALHVEDDAGKFRVIRVARELGHQRKARTGRRRHRTGARPARTEHHAGGRQLVLGLNDRRPALAGLRIGAIAVAELDERLAQRRRRRDRIPRGKRASAHDAAQRGRAVAVHEHQAVRNSAHRLETKRIALLEMLAGVLDAQAHRRHVRLDRGRLALELRGHRSLERLDVDSEKFGHRSDVDHVR